MLANRPDATRVSYTTKTFVGSSATVFVPIFRVTGIVRVVRLWAVVTTALGPNHTDIYFCLNDQTARLALTLIAGAPNLNAAPIGSAVIRRGLAALVAVARSSAAGAFTEPVSDGSVTDNEFVAQQKTGGINTDIEYCYKTTDAPTTGAMQFWCEYQYRALPDLSTLVAL